MTNPMDFMQKLARMAIAYRDKNQAATGPGETGAVAPSMIDAHAAAPAPAPDMKGSAAPPTGEIGTPIIGSRAEADVPLADRKVTWQERLAGGLEGYQRAKGEEQQPQAPPPLTPMELPQYNGLATMTMPRMASPYTPTEPKRRMSFFRNY